METQIETRTRNVKQSYRKFTNEQRRKIVLNIMNRPSHIGIMEACEQHGIRNPMYYMWKKKLRITNKVSEPVKSHLPSGWTDEQKSNFVNRVENLPVGVKKSEVIRRAGITKQTYYYWRSQFGITKVYKPTTKSMNHPMFSKTKRGLQNVPTNHTITVSVESKSIMDLINVCNTLTKIPNVKSVLSVE